MPRKEGPSLEEKLEADLTPRLSRPGVFDFSRGLCAIMHVPTGEQLEDEFLVDFWSGVGHSIVRYTLLRAIFDAFLSQKSGLQDWELLVRAYIYSKRSSLICLRFPPQAFSVATQTPNALSCIVRCMACTDLSIALVVLGHTSIVTSNPGVYHASLMGVFTQLIERSSSIIQDYRQLKK